MIAILELLAAIVAASGAVTVTLAVSLAGIASLWCWLRRPQFHRIELPGGEPNGIILSSSPVSAQDLAMLREQLSQTLSWGTLDG